MPWRMGWGTFLPAPVEAMAGVIDRKLNKLDMNSELSYRPLML